MNYQIFDDFLFNNPLWLFFPVKVKYRINGKSYFVSSLSMCSLMAASVTSLSILKMGMILCSSYNSFGSYRNTSQRLIQKQKATKDPKCSELVYKYTNIHVDGWVRSAVKDLLLTCQLITVLKQGFKHCWLCAALNNCPTIVTTITLLSYLHPSIWFDNKKKTKLRRTAIILSRPF